MKITWVGGAAFRVQVSGKIYIFNPDTAGDGVNSVEFKAGADIVLSFADNALDDFDFTTFKPRTYYKSDVAVAEEDFVKCMRIGKNSIMMDAIGEAPLVMLDSHDAEKIKWARWADGCVVIIYKADEGLAQKVDEITARSRLKLIGLVANDDIENVFGAVVPHLDGAGLVVLEPRMALEI